MSWLAALALALSPAAALAQVFNFTPELDNSLFIDSCSTTLVPVPNPFVCKSNGAGPHIIVNATPPLRRGLVQFDVSSISPGSEITSVTLTLHTSLVDDLGTGANTVSLQRVSEQWGEGTSDSGTGVAGSSLGGGQGAPGAVGDATWRWRLFVPPAGGLLWAVDGGTFSGNLSATATSPAFSTPPGDFVTFASTLQLVADVEAWVDGTLPNFGWLIDTDDGGERWDSREHPNPAFRPVLTVTVPEPGTSGAALAALGTLLALRARRRSRTR